MAITINHRDSMNTAKCSPTRRASLLIDVMWILALPVARRTTAAVRPGAVLFDAGRHLVDLPVGTFYDPAFGAMALLARPQATLGIARVALIYDFSLNTIPSPQQGNCCHRACSLSLNCIIRRWLARVRGPIPADPHGSSDREAPFWISRLGSSIGCGPQSGP